MLFPFPNLKNELRVRLASCSVGICGTFFGDKAEREPDISYPSVDDGKNDCSYSLLPRMSLFCFA